MWLLAQKYCLIAMLLLPKAVSTVRRSRETGFAGPPSPEREKWLAYPHGASGHGDPNVNVRHYIPAVLGRATVGHLLLPWWDRTLQLAQAGRGRWGGGVEAMGMRVSSRGHTWGGSPSDLSRGSENLSNNVMLAAESAHHVWVQSLCDSCLHTCWWWAVGAQGCPLRMSMVSALLSFPLGA